MKCHCCGNKLSDEKNFCPKCGVPIHSKTSKSEDQPQTIDKSKIEDKLKQLDEIYKRQKTAKKITPKILAPSKLSSSNIGKNSSFPFLKSDKNTIEKVVLIIILLLILFIPTYFFLKNSKKKKNLLTNKTKKKIELNVNETLPAVFKRSQKEINLREKSLNRNLNLYEREKEFMKMAQEVSYNDYKKIEEIGWLVFEYGCLNEDEEIRLQTSFFVSQLKDSAGMPILKTLENNDSAIIYYSSLVGFYFLGEKTTIKLIINALQEETGKTIINSIIKTIIGIKDKDLQNILFNFLDDEDYEVRKNSAFALAEIGMEESIYVLDEVINNDYSDEEKIKAAVFLAKINKNSADQLIEEKIENANGCIQLLFSIRLSELGDEQSKNSIIYSLEEVDDEEKVINALCLAKLNYKPAISLLKDSINNEEITDKELLYQIGLTLGEKGEKNLSIPILLEIISDSEMEKKLESAYNIIKLTREKK